jgi:hypothetical protein
VKEIHRIIRRAAHGLRAAVAAVALAAIAAPSVLAADEKPAPEVAPAVPPAVAPAVAPGADKLLKRMGDYLAQAQFFSVNGEVWQDIELASGQRIQVSRTIRLQVRRPDRFHAEVNSTRRSHALYYDGHSITLFNRLHNFYGAIPAPSSLDEALDAACERFGITIPLEDLIVSDPYHSALAHVTSGRDLGPVTVLGVPCEHLAFIQPSVDWQVWIQDGPKPVPRKVVITYKEEEDSPQYTAILSDWDFETKLPDFLFTFEPPAGAVKIAVAEIKNENEAREKEAK